jgi:ABC-type nitrate/sulfonate/bicarbonate transport system permease component
VSLARTVVPDWGTLFRHLRLSAALPCFLGRLKISGGLALIGAVVTGLGRLLLRRCHESELESGD